VELANEATAELKIHNELHDISKSLGLEPRHTKIAMPADISIWQMHASGLFVR
jgi:hypothetical protein